LRRAGKLTELAAALAENGKIAFCEEKVAFSAAFLSAAALAAVYRSEDFSRGKFFPSLFAEVDFFISLIEAV